jgi:integrase
MYADLLDHGRQDGKGLSPRTVRYVHTILRRALKEAVRTSKVGRNVADYANPPSGKTHANFTTWTAEELHAFLEYVGGDRLKAAWYLAAMTGMRRGEVLGLRWRDCDLERGRVTIAQTLVLVHNRLAFAPPKTKRSRRTISIDDETLSVLKAHRARQAEEKLGFGAGYNPQDLVFAGPDGSPVKPDHFSDRFERLSRAAGLPRIRLHELRHTHATLAFAANVHPKVISERLGHSSIAFTLEVYSGSIPSMQEEAAATIARVVFSA